MLHPSELRHTFWEMLHLTKHRAFPQSYASPCWATLHPLNWAVPYWAKVNSAELRCTPYGLAHPNYASVACAYAKISVNSKIKKVPSEHAEHAHKILMRALSIRIRNFSVHWANAIRTYACTEHTHKEQNYRCCSSYSAGNDSGFFLSFSMVVGVAAWSLFCGC
jgi:hypothetical protein